jgi:hypothetical protein
MTQLFSLFVPPNRNSLTLPPTPDTSIATAIESKLSPLIDVPIIVQEDEQPKRKQVQELDDIEVKYMIEGLGIHYYIGTIDKNGQKCGRGELIYPNGVTYEGEFLNDTRHGFGKLMQNIDGTNLQVALGEWVFDKPSEVAQWKITRGTWHYFGQITLIKSKKKSKPEIITIDHLLRHNHVCRYLTTNQQGELHELRSNFKYFGNFIMDKRDGFGVCTFGNGDRYYGVWKDDMLSDQGTYIYKNGNLFQGKFSRGIRKGKGILYMPSGDSIDGTWEGDKISSAVHRFATPQTFPT